MAQIDFNNISKIEKERNLVHEKVQATYSVFENDGKKYLQIDTYGSSSRKIPEKISQSFQLDKEDAKTLIDLLIHEIL